MAKQYGLIVPGKDKDKFFKRPTIFGDDSDSDEAPQKPTGLNTTLKKQHKLNQQKVLEDDPTVYQYDEIYDDMDKKRKESKLSKKDLDRKPKYIGRLLAAADRRKKDNERRIERQIQKERETEGEEFKDKESFVTNAYKKKLEEMKELEEQEKREAYLESIGDVTKQVNLDGFYRHLYDQKVNQEEKAHEEIKENLTTKKVSSEKRKSSSDSEDSSSKNVNKKSERQYRTRKDSDNSDQQDDIKKEHLPSNLDADSDFSIDSSDSDEDKETLTVKEPDGNMPPPANLEIKEEKNIEDETKENDIKIEPTPKKPKLDIWKKRTVGEVFDAALIRYFERKATASY